MNSTSARPIATRCTQTDHDHLFIHPFCPNRSLLQKIASVVFHVLTLGIPLIVVQLVRCCFPRKATPHTETALPAQALTSVQTATPIKIDRMATEIESEEAIQALTEINGVPLDIIEKRARPAVYDRDEGTRTGGEAYSGFLGTNESLKEVLLQDWRTVRKMGVSHIELAGHLGNIVNQAAGLGSYHTEVTFTYDSAILKAKHQTLSVTYGMHKGEQTDIFRKTTDQEYEGAWNGYCHITNKTTGAHVQWSPGVQQYISKYGFYEGGGKKNAYRVDPISLFSILTGRTEAELQKAY